MTNCEIINLPSVAYYSGLNGLEIKRIDYGTFTRVLCVTGCWYGGPAAKQAHRVKIQYTRAGRPFIRIHGHRIPLDDCCTIA